MARAEDQAAAPDTAPPSAADPNAQSYSKEQLDQMLAPIALYPDQLVTNVLMAATFQDQLAEAQKWLNDPAHAGLQGDALMDAVKPLNWDPSVKALVQFPQIVDLMMKNPNWTGSLGNAFDNQQDKVMAEIQFLRQTARKAGNLASNDKMVVQDSGPNIVISPAEPGVVYAPYYNPAVVYGAWPYPAYRPIWFPGAYFGIGPLGIGVGWGWGPRWGYAAPLWGWYGVRWGLGGGLFFRAGFGPRFGWYGHGWRGVGWRGGGWRHGGYGHWGHPGWRAGYHRGFRAGEHRGFRAGEHRGAGHGVGHGGGTHMRGGGHTGLSRPGGGHAAGGHFGHGGGGHSASRGGHGGGSHMMGHGGGGHSASSGRGGGRGGGHHR